MVFKYTVSGILQGYWTISTTSPTGITLDPTNSASPLWIVDNANDSVYQFARPSSTSTSGALSGSVFFTLAPGNTNPQGIADPPSPSSGLIAGPASIVSNSAFMQAPVVSLGVPSTERAAQSQRVLAVTESVDEFMSQLASLLPAAPISVSKAQSAPLHSRTRFADDRSIDLALADEELNEPLHTMANELLAFVHS